MQIRKWFRKNPYGQYSYRVLLAAGSAAVTVGLSFLPFETVLQAIWVMFSSLLIGYLLLRGRLNETDDARYRRLFRGRFEHLAKTNPEALTTIFSDNVGRPVMRWFEDEYDVPISQAKAVDALDSLSRTGDQPGQLIFRVGVELGKWLKECEGKGEDVTTLEFVEAEIATFIQRNEHLLGEEIADGIYFRHVKRGSRRPIGIHMFHPKSKCLFTVEDQDFRGERHSVALSAKTGVFTSDKDWELFKEYVYREFPYFQPGRGGSGPQKRGVPLFVVSGFDTWTEEKEVIREKLLRLDEGLPATADNEQADEEPADEDQHATDPAD